MQPTPSASYSLTLRVKLSSRAGSLGELASAIGRAGGDIGAIDIVSAGAEFVASAGGGSFFEEYAKLGGEQTQIGTYLAPAITGRLSFTDHLRITAYASFHKAEFSELYHIRSSTDPRVPSTARSETRRSRLALE